MSARDVVARAAWQVDRDLCGAPPDNWETFKADDPETAAIYETQAGAYLSALTAAGWVVARVPMPWPIHGNDDEKTVNAAKGWNGCREATLASGEDGV